MMTSERIDVDASSPAAADGNTSGGAATAGESQNDNSSPSNDDNNVGHKKIDQITALQESIDR